MDPKCLLFIDDKPDALRALERALAPLRGAWAMDFIDEPRRALARLAAEPFDVVVVDARLSGAEGLRLLGEVMLRQPQAVRIVLADDREATLEALGVSHQVLARPVDAAALRATVERTLALRTFLDGATPLKALVARLDSLPSLPTLYADLVCELQSPLASPERVERIISRDPAMAAKVLQLVNSAYFALAHAVNDLPTAVRLLGLDTVKALVLTLQAFSQFDDAALGALPLEPLWQHSLHVGALARCLAALEQAPAAVVNDAFSAGLLHDIGKLILAANLPGLYAKRAPLMAAEGIDECEAERRLFGAAHAETGAYLLGLWGLPPALVEAVAYHHQPLDCVSPGTGALAFVHAANALSQAMAPEPTYLERLGLLERLPVWRALDIAA